jgi:hypothetical protein
VLTDIAGFKLPFFAPFSLNNVDGHYEAEGVALCGVMVRVSEGARTGSKGGGFHRFGYKVLEVSGMRHTAYAKVLLVST